MGDVQCAPAESTVSAAGNVADQDRLQADLLQRERRSLTEEFSGFTIDNTITRLGHEFTRELSNFRNANFPSSDYNISVVERPSAASGSTVWIEHNFIVLYRGVLQPNTDLKQLAERVMPAVNQAIRQRRLQELLGGSEDLAPPEL